jgi:ketosteroid isomerase-like protein
MTSNRATVEELIRRMNARDVHPTELCHDDVEWHWPATTPGAAVFRGLEDGDQLEDGLLRRWWMFGDAEKARRRFVAGDRPG